jgi:hypothetical protein
VLGEPLLAQLALVADRSKVISKVFSERRHPEVVALLSKLAVIWLRAPPNEITGWQDSRLAMKVEIDEGIYLELEALAKRRRREIGQLLKPDHPQLLQGTEEPSEHRRPTWLRCASRRTERTLIRP